MTCIRCKAEIPENAVYCHLCGKKQTTTRKKAKKRANGMGTIVKKPGKRSKPWEAQKAGVYVGCYETRYEAEQALNRLLDSRISDTFNLTFKGVYERWKPEHARNITAKGMDGYINAYKHCSSLYKRIFRKLRASDFQAVIMDMEEKGLSEASCKKVIQLFGQLSKWAVREGICHTNYAPFVTVAKTEQKCKATFTPAQIKAIQSATSPAATVALILIATGCRPNELFSVKVEDCHDGYFISGSKTEAGKNRVIPVTSLGKPAYNSLLTAARDAGQSRLIAGYSGRNKTYANFAKRDWVDLMKECGIENMTPYNCRHTFTTLAVKSNVRPEILQKILGHANYSTTVDVYTHLGIDDIISESQKVSVTVSVTDGE